MASGGRGRRAPQKKEEEESGGFGTAGAILGALAGIAGLAVAGKVVYDKYKEKQERQEQMMQQQVEASKRQQLDMFDANFGSSSRRSSGGPDVPRPLINRPCPQLDEAFPSSHEDAPPVEEAFSQKLQNYYTTYADIGDELMWRAGRVVDDVKNVIRTYLRQSQSQLGITDLEVCGSFGEGLQVICPDECDLLIPIHLPGTMWTEVKGGTLRPRTPGYHLIRRLNSADHPMGSSPYDEYVDSDYLSPAALITGLKGMIEEAAKEITEYSVKYDVSGPDMTLHITYDGSRYIDIDFVPAIVIGSRWMVAAPHHDVISDSSLWNRWRESYHVQEKAYLTRWPGNLCCHLKILKIMKAIRLNNRAQFRILSSYVYKTLLLEMMMGGLSRNEWTNDDLQERFIDMLHLLEGHLLKRHLPHAFDPDVNLLDSVSDVVCTTLRNYIAGLIGNQRLEDALVRSYRGKYGHVGDGSPSCGVTASGDDVVYY